MARDITVKVTGQNSDGSFNIQMPDGGNPFMNGGGQQQTGMVYQPTTTTAPVGGGYRARIAGVEVMFASEADYLKADKAMAMSEQNNIPTVGGGFGGRGTGSWIRTGAEAAGAVGAFLNGRAIRGKLNDLQDSLDDRKAAMVELDALAIRPDYAPLIPILKKLFLAERDSTETSVALLEDQLTAVDIQTGAGVAKVVGEMYDGAGSRTGGSEGGTGSLLGIGAAGLGLGLLMSNNRTDSRTARRRF